MNQAIHNVDLLALADGRRRVDRGPHRHAGPRADRGRRHGRRLPSLQERRPRRDRGGHERLSGPAQADRDPRRPRLGPGRAGRHHALGLPGEGPQRQRDLRGDGGAAPASRPAPATRAASPTSATATSSPTSSQAIDAGRPPPSTAARAASRSRSSAPSIARPAPARWSSCR